MPYCTEADIISQVGQNNIIPFLDDDQDGAADSGLLDNIITQASDQVDGFIASVYDTPLSTVSGSVKYATIIFVCEILYRRRLTPQEQNPYREEAKRMREWLTRVSDGELALDVNVPQAFVQGGAASRSTIFGVAGSNQPFNTM